ncbi:hypothetical protein KTD31_03470 [Burkholderia multivorans]|uniref:hypothetical protein n=1 Tax=Burkholderia multivorans TaxID=87883 RepID=UPI001C229108|nr:hypothetical protein [Burkholderia multivorans]MBU9200413.1 hypothetical protein [Burkholderia multivorans]MDN8078462.1 hypothetical protein [Burkholderia multivorans]
MTKIVIAILALAAYGAYCLFGSSPAQKPAPEAVTAPTSESGVLSRGVASLASGLVAKTAGVQMLPMPEEGCSTSVIAPTQVEALVNSLPAGQREALATVMSASSGLWTMQLYKGSQGVGLCLPTRNTLMLMPSGLSDKVSALGSAAGAQ